VEKAVFAQWAIRSHHADYLVMSEHRIATRHRILKAGTIEFSGDAIPCTVRNISETGAALEINSPLWFPDQFTLSITSDGLRKPCHIVWRREKRIGIAFD
jgi:hypothetical protein